MSAPTAPIPPVTRLDLVGALIAQRYRVGDLLDRGGMSLVYYATDLQFHRPCVVKIAVGLHPCARLEREAVIGGRLKVPGLVEVREQGFLDEGQAAYAIFEYLDGETLGVRLNRGPMPWEEALRVGARVARILAALHQAGVIHRDVKPENLFLLRSGEVKVIDLGIACADGLPPMTGRGEVLGSLPYMPPEQLVNASQVDWRADIYALGLVLARAMGGPKALPSITSTDPDVFREDARKRAPLGLVAPHLPPEVSAVVERACAVDPDARYALMAEFADALEGVLRRRAELEARRVAQAARRRTVGMVLGALGLLGLGYAAGYMTHRVQGPRGDAWVAGRLPARQPADVEPLPMPGPSARSGDEGAQCLADATQGLERGRSEWDESGMSGEGPAEEKGQEMKKLMCVAAIGMATVVLPPRPGVSGKPPEPCKVDSDCKKNQACKPAGSLGMWCADYTEQCAPSRYRFTKKAPERLRGKCWVGNVPRDEDAKAYY